MYVLHLNSMIGILLIIIVHGKTILNEDYLSA